MGRRAPTQGDCNRSGARGLSLSAEVVDHHQVGGHHAAAEEDASRARSLNFLRCTFTIRPHPTSFRRHASAGGSTGQPGVDERRAPRSRPPGSQLPHPPKLARDRAAWHEPLPSPGSWPHLTRRQPRRAPPGDIVPRPPRSTRSSVTSWRRSMAPSTTTPIRRSPTTRRASSLPPPSQAGRSPRARSG